MMSDTFTPKMAIVIYECSDKDSGLYLERRDIVNGQMGAGKPLTQKCITSIMKSIAVEESDSDYRLYGAVPQNLLHIDFSPGKLKLVWYNPPQKRYAYFAKSTGIQDGEMYVPGLIYIADGDKLTMYAFKGRKPKDKLYRAPFMNVSDDGVCLGNSKMKKPKDATIQSQIDYWESMFWKSEFSHLLGGNPVSCNLATLSKHLIESGEKFPNEVLIPSKHTLKSILR